MISFEIIDRLFLLYKNSQDIFKFNHYQIEKIPTISGFIWQLQKETKREVRQRSYNCILNICKNTIYDIIGVATHGFFIREFLRSLDYEDDSKIKNCEVVKAMYDDGNLKILERFEK